MAINQMFDLHLWDGWLWQKKGSIHWFISTHSPATCWFIAVVYMFLVNILLFGDPRTCIDIALCVFFLGIHPCLLLIGGNSSACLLTRFIFSAALYRDIHSYRSRFFVMKFWIFGVHGNHCLLSVNQAWQVCSLNFPFISWIFSSPFKAPFLGGDFPVSLVWFLLLDPRFHLAKKSPICRRLIVQSLITLEEHAVWLIIH